tara:strand:+ start:1520 stop:1711 length:192 start_codon:yes stop_codon:yes gene_type:complete
MHQVDLLEEEHLLAQILEVHGTLAVVAADLVDPAVVVQVLQVVLLSAAALEYQVDMGFNCILT